MKMLRSSSANKPCTRYGTISSPSTKIGREERFLWQKSKSTSDGVYDLPDLKSTRIITFGTAQRMAEQSNIDSGRRTTGPGSYDYGHCYDKISEHRHRHGNRFGGAPRESMDLKTPSPGPVYNISKLYWNGADKGIKIGFNCDSRPPLHNLSLTANADMLYPKLQKGKAITMAPRLRRKTAMGNGSGIIYDVHEKTGFKTGPSFSFGRGQQDRFSQIAFLPEIDF